MSRKKNQAANSGPSPNAFGALDALGELPDGPAESPPVAPIKTSKRGQNNKRGRVDIVRQTAGRGGKGVTVAKNFKGISLAEKEELAKKMRKACGVGGTVKNDGIEIQGDKRDEVKRILEESGFQPVFAGG